MKARRLRLGRDRKLHGSRVFAAIRAAGLRRVCGCLILNWRRVEADLPPKLGVVTSRRLGGAVIRSRARRLIREAFRQQQHQILRAVEVVLVARPSLVGKPIAIVTRDLQRCLREAGLWKPEGEPVGPSVAVPTGATVNPKLPCDSSS